MAPSWLRYWECSRPKTQAQMFTKKKYIYLFKAISKKRSSKFFFRRSPKKNTKKVFENFPRVSSVLQHNFNGAKNSAVFLRTGGFEAKANAKAKDFKMCPQGQRRPRELHLCLEYKSNQIKSFIVLAVIRRSE